MREEYGMNHRAKEKHERDGHVLSSGSGAQGPAEAVSSSQ